ncbi:MAG: glycosyltransferase, partial [Desulfovibrio sp.]|nr:glycosyltransferase [Desulfovibrio sp.]
MCARPNPPDPEAPADLVLLHGRDPRASLAALAEDGSRPRVIVLQAPGGSPPDAEEARALGERLLRQGRLAGFALEELAPGEDWREAANRILLPLAQEDASTRPPFLFLLSAAVQPEAGCHSALTRRLASEPALAGVSPLLLSPPGEATPRRVRHMGSVFDSRRELHVLYEGLPAGHPLAQKRRFFQVAPDDALMVRLEGFCAAGGFSASLDELAPLDLCFRLGGGRAAFSTEPAALAALHDVHAGLGTAACWNSLVQRGRIPPGTGHPDYARHALADGLGYGCTPWLAEGAHLPEALLESDTWDDAWLAWRRTPEPASLLRLLARSAPEEIARLVDLCRAYPALLPHAFPWYAAQARHMEAFAEAQDLPQLKEDAAFWQRGETRFRHRMLRPGMRALAEAGLWACSLDAAASTYDAWMELREPELRPARVATGAQWPEIAVLMPVWNPRPDHLAAALDSVLAQSYGRWQLCVADDASSDPAIPQLLRAYAAKDPRIRLVIREENGHISHATNSALALADAPWAAFFDHDDLLAPTALEETAAVIAGRPEVRYVYTDEDKIDEDGVRRTPVFKPGFDGDLAAMGHLTTCATGLVREVGGLRPGFEGSQDFDLSLRMTERLEPRQVAHIPRVLYHWRIHAGSTAGSLASKPYVLEATRKALTESAHRKGHAVEGAASSQNNFFKLILGVPPALTCSVVLLADPSTAGLVPEPKLMGVLAALAAVMQVEVLWQPLTPLAPGPQDCMDDGLPRPGRLTPAGPHWTGACVNAAQAARGDVLLFLHAGLTPVLDCRPEQMVIQALRPDLALVGGLLWKGGRLWNGGYAPDVTGLPFPLLRGASPLDLRTHCWGHFLLTRHVLGIDWRCMAVRRKLLLEPGALDAGMGALAGVDYSLRQEAHGRFTLVSP